jgi:phospholipid/cholesterol/gamma-HCH transport system ATP-binding protein
MVVVSTPARSAPIAIRFEDVWYSIGEKPVLCGVTFDVPRGRTKVILGPSGTGKSTILRLLLGLIRPDRGRVLVDGREITTLSRRELDAVRHGMGMVFQDGALFDSLTVGENVGFALMHILKWPMARVDSEARRLLDLVGLEPDLADNMPDELSGGMQRRVAIARALAGEPSILLYDEPTTGLDPTSVEQITNVMVALRERLQITSIVVTHHITDALKVGSRFVLLGDGVAQFNGSGPELLASTHPAVVDFLQPFRESVRAAMEHIEDAEEDAGGDNGDAQKGQA